MAVKKIVDRNHKTTKLAVLLGLKPEEIRNISAEWTGTGPVEIDYEGKVYMSQEAWMTLISALHAEEEA